ncbi:MAG: replicative DNA helicase [Chloroflexi bacterium]|nr:MAG: replicative DNA helicase [Chloroflexota bacterium]
MYAERLLPHDADAEEAVIGAVLIDSTSLTQISSFLRPEDFYLSRTRSCYASFIALFDRGEAINQITVAHELSLKELLDDVGGSNYLGQLVTTVPTSAHIEHYARIVQTSAVMRQLISVAGDIATIGYEGSSDSDVSLRDAEALLYGVRTTRATGDFQHIRTILDEYMEQTASIDFDDASLTPIQTGFPDLDKILGNGLSRSDLIVLAARPSLGKSSLAFNIARNAAEKQIRTGIFSLEMSAEQIGNRLLSAEAAVDSHRLRLGVLSESEERRVLDAIGLLSELPIYMDDTPIQGTVEIRGKARRLQAEKGLDLIIVDYMQLMANSNRRSDNRTQEMGEISRSLKGLARDLNVPVLALSQLSRASEHRPSHRPILSDLRESGSIEQDADVVAFIYREDHYTTREDWERREPSRPYPENIAEIIVAKHRNGPTGAVPLYFRKELVKFESLERRSRSPELV